MCCGKIKMLQERKRERERERYVFERDKTKSQIKKMGRKSELQLGKKAKKISWKHEGKRVTRYWKERE